MRVRSVLLAGVVCAALMLIMAPATLLGREPPNQRDPCAAVGQDTCGTTGVGFYQRYRYGIRWFGDYRGAVPDEPHTFCIDLRYWYPSPDYRYKQQAAGVPLKNRDGDLVSTGSQERMAYAVWSYGRSSNPTQQAAVMLYVHGLMGDAAPGEVDAAGVNPRVEAVYARVKRDAERYHGPYHIDATLSSGLTVGKPAQATVRVLSAEGNPLPNLQLTLNVKGADGLPARVRTNGAGTAQVALTPTDATGVRLHVATESLPSTLPRVFAPTVRAAARNGQRLVAPGSQRVSFDVSAPVAPSQIEVASTAAPPLLAAGQQVVDQVTIKGVAPDWKATVGLRMYGPFRSVAAIRCDQPPAVDTSFDASGSDTVAAPVQTVGQPGWYTFVITVPGDADHLGATTPCGEPSETFRVQAQPGITTTVSAASVLPGTPITDSIAVSGLAGETVTVNAALYGPFPSADKVVCTGSPVWSGTVDAVADGTYTTAPFTITVPGYYTYQVGIAATDFLRAAGNGCGEPTESTVAVGHPTVTTAVSSQQTAPGATITDQAILSGLGAVAAQVNVELWGPFPSAQAIACVGTPYWTGSFTATGDGTYTTQPVQLQTAGYYTYRESIAGSPANDAAQTTCGDAAETTLAQAQPVVGTIVSNEVVRPGSPIFDRIRVSGLAKTPVPIDVELFGPFATRAAIRCIATPFWSGQVTAAGDGEVRSPSVKLTQAGFYAYHEHIAGSPVVAEVTTDCAQVAETSLSAPAITTGRGEQTAVVPAPQGSGPAPTRVTIANLRIDAPVAPVGVDVADGVLGVPPNIHRTGWWRDGAAPGDSSGVVLIAGHVDSKTAGAGAFFNLPRARAGTRVAVTTDDGATHAYRVTAVRRYLKKDLPTNVYSLRGRPRLVLVTCGGPFDYATGHYRDNIVVTAVPV